MFNAPPATLIDDALTSRFGRASRSSWDELRKPTIADQRIINQQQYEQFLQSEPTTKVQPTQFSPVSIPTIQ